MLARAGPRPVHAGPRSMAAHAGAGQAGTHADPVPSQSRLRLPLAAMPPAAGAGQGRAGRSSAPERCPSLHPAPRWWRPACRAPAAAAPRCPGSAARRAGWRRRRPAGPAGRAPRPPCSAAFGTPAECGGERGAAWVCVPRQARAPPCQPFLTTPAPHRTLLPSLTSLPRIACCCPPHAPCLLSLCPCLLEVVKDVAVPRQRVAARVGAAAERAAHTVVGVAQPRQQPLYLPALGLQQLQAGAGGRSVAMSGG